MHKQLVSIEQTPFSFSPETYTEIRSVVGLFDQYLDGFHGPAVNSRHAIMGPVGKILSVLKGQDWDADALTGFGLRAHESAGMGSAYITSECLENLRQGVSQLLALVAEKPSNARAKIVKQVESELYYQRQRRNITARYERTEKLKALLSAFLKQRYRDDAEFQAAWGKERFVSMEKLPFYFGAKSATYKRAKGAMKADMTAFYAWAGTQDSDLVEDDDNDAVEAED